MTHSDAPIIDESGFTKSGFAEFGLADTILQSIEKEGFTVPTEIQSMALPPLMAGHDLIGIAQTGGGKTAAFSLPMINKLVQDYQRPRQNMPRVLILAPTRELAIQIEQCIATFSKGTKISSLVVAGGQPYPPQTNKLRRGVDIVVATPGRLIDHINRKNIKFADTNIFILDEADRMLDMGFIDDVRDIANSLPEEHQTVLFSATMNPKVRGLSKALLNDPVNVEIYQKTAVANTITHKLMNVSRKNKAQLLSEILSGDNVEKVLVFARTKMGADELSKILHEKGIRSDAIHGDKRQRVREKILMNFRRGRTKVLVATDVAARGIDVDGISHVVNYELPIEPENYIHRVGRTGRAGNKGIAISFCDPSDMRLLVPIERMIKLAIEVDEAHDYHIDVSARGKAGGNKGRFSRERGGAGRDRNAHTRNGRREDGFKRDGQRANVIKRGKFAEDRDVRRSTPKKPANNFKQDRPVRPESKNLESKNPEFKRPKSKRHEAKRYDPWTAEAKKYSDDPVLGKLIGKPPKVDSKKENKSDFVKTGETKKKSFKKKSGESKLFERKKLRGGKKVMAESKSPEKSSSLKIKAKGKAKAKVKRTGVNQGGNKVFAPKRKILRPSRAA